LLRPGTINAEDLARIIGPIVLAGREDGDSARRSPGMMERHYSPRARLMLLETRDVAPTATREHEHGRIVGALVIDAELAPGSVAITSRMPSDSATYANRLYESLHAMDDDGCDVIVVERVPGGQDWAGVRDRLERAAHPDQR
jgi:L-threonylcarbamoyladenylate synthase